MPEERRPSAMVGRLPSNSLLKMRILRASELGQDEAEMGLTILNRRPVIDTSPEPSLAPPPEGEEEEPTVQPQTASETDALLGDILLSIQAIFDEMFDRPGTPRSVANVISTSSADYVPVATWTIPTNLVGQIREISLTTDDLATAQWKLDIADVEQWTDLAFDDPLSVIFPANNKIAGDKEVTISVKSDGVITLSANASISGIEREP